MNYLTPSQLGVFHHRLHLSSARRHVVCEEPGITPRRITNDETWAFNTKIYNDIIVESGAELRICGELFMPKDGSIIVERGARLVVDGGRISIDREELENCPEVRWSGILVNGNPDRLHANVDINNLQADDPGVVIIENGALIERAAVAVAASADRRSFQYATSTPITTARAPFAGGIIRAHNSTFLNNTESVRIDNYRHANRSLFTDCVFDTDSDSAEVGINAYRVHSFLVLNCDFSRMNGSGIALNQAPIDISGGNLFEFCQIGVYAVGYNFFGINTEIGEDFLFGDARTRFLNNAVGVHIGNVNGVEIINNGFTDNSTGVIISGESIFTVNKNTFLGGSQATRYEQTGFNNLNNLLCNVYNETGTAAHFIGDNRSVIINGNDFSRVGDFQGAPNRDINLYPAYNDGTVSLGRLKIQGGPNDGRRNRFRTLSSGNNVSRDIVTYVDATSNEYQTVPFTYFALADQAQIYEPECTLNVPCQNETNNYFMQVVLSGNAICTGISPPDGANEACEDIACLNGKYTTIDNLNTQWDGGNTATYRNALQSSGNGNYALYNSINQQSPLISEKILQMLIAQSWINTNTKAQLLSANVPLSKATLDAASGVLSTPQMDSIYIQQNTNPQLNRIDLKRAVLEAEQRKNYGLQTLVSTLYQNNDLSGAQSVLTNDGSELAQRLHIDLLLWTEDSTAAHNLLNAYTNTGIDADDYEQMTQYALAPPIFDGAWDNATHADLTYRAEQDGLFAGLAQSLLLRHERIFFLPDLTNGKALKEDPVSQRTDKIAPAERKRVMSNESMRIMPNPARDLLHLILPVDVPTNVRVYNLQGKLLKAAVLSGNSQLDVNGLPRGVVIVRLEHPMHKQTIKLLLQ